MDDYEADRVEALFRETDRVIRTLERAVDDSKPVDEVLYAMRLDWLQGIYINGGIAYFDDKVYDLGYFDSEFDLFTFDIGHGKGHGHRAGQMAPGNDREQGFVIGGQQASGDISELRGRPSPDDGERRRYDKATQSGHGAPNRRSDYEIGLQQNRADGVYNYNQAADMRVERRGQAPKKPTRSSRGPSKRRPAPKSRSSYLRPAPKRPTTYRRKPQQPYQRTR